MRTNKGYEPFTELLNAEIEKLVADGVTLRDIAGEMGVTTMTLSDWRNGKSSPNLVSFLKVCEIFRWPYPLQLKPPEPAWRQRLRARNDDEGPVN